MNGSRWQSTHIVLKFIHRYENSKSVSGSIADAVVKKFRSDEIDLAISQKRRKLFLNLVEFERAGNMFGLKEVS